MSMDASETTQEVGRAPSESVDDLDFALEKILDLEEEVTEMRAEYETTIEQQRRRIADLEERLEELDQRTDMLRIVEEADTPSGEQRSATLLQYLRDEAEEQAAKGRKPVASIAKPDAKQILHNPDIDRTTYYSDFDRCVRWVGDKDVCWKESKDRTRLLLDLRHADENEISVAIRNGGD